MKLLFDENLSPKLVTRLAIEFPESAHVSRVGLDQADDETVWAFAREYTFTIVTKDADFQEISLRLGMPPKVVWLRVAIAALMRRWQCCVTMLMAYAHFLVIREVRF